MTETKNKTLANITKGVSVAMTGFSLLLCFLLTITFIQMKRHDPLDPEMMQNLMVQLENDTQNQALRDQIRALDLLARKAYFTTQWQIQTGSYILLASIFILLISLKIHQHINRKEPLPQGCPDANDIWFVKTKARKIVAICGIVLISGSLTAAWISHSNLSIVMPAETEQIQSDDNIQIYWANFRGPGGNGIAVETSGPTDWDVESGKNIRWKSEVPLPGYSSPVIWENHLYLTGATSDKQEIYCFSTESGELIWTKEIIDIPGNTGQAPTVHDDTGYAPSSMATDGRHVCAIFPTGDLICVNPDGEQIWAQNLGLPDNYFGHASSLLIFENLLIIQYDQSSRGKLLALDVATGETKWQAGRSFISWASPICVNTGSRMELIVNNNQSVESYDPRTGIKLWGHDVMSGDMGPSAAYENGMVFAATDYSVVVGIRITDNGSEIAWEYDENLPDTSSPLAAGGRLFFLTSYGYIVCLDAQSGQMLWEQEFDDGFYASPILVGDNIYAMDLQGNMHIFKTAGEYQSVADISIGETSACTPAFAGGRMYVRGEKHLFCIEEL